MRINPEYFRSAEVDLLIGNPVKAKETLSWQAEANLEQLCQKMTLNP